MKKIISILLSAMVILSMSIGVYAESEKEIAAQELEKYGIIGRNNLGELTVDGPVTRAGITKMLVLMLGSECAEESSDFTDVPYDHWACGYIVQAKKLRIINGIGDGTFAPEEYVTYQQAIKMIVCALGYGADAEQKGGYPHGYVMMAMNLGIAPSKAIMTESADRGEILVMLAKALDVPIMVAKDGENKIIYSASNRKDNENFITMRTILEQ